MSQSSPEGIVLGKGSTLVKMELSVSEKQQTDILDMGQIPTKETLEEAAEKLTKDFPHYSVRDNMDDSDIKGWFLEALQKGVKWQQEQDKNKFSEEEVLEILNEFSVACYSPIEKFEIPEWFKKFKKK